MTAALFYLVITLPLAKFVGNLEAKLANTDGGSAPGKRKKSDKKASAVAAAEVESSVAISDGEAAMGIPMTQEGGNRWAK